MKNTNSEIINKIKAKERDGYKCVKCNSTEDLHVHHTLPKMYGGSNEVSNLVTLCKVHHLEKHPEYQTTRLYNKHTYMFLDTIYVIFNNLKYTLLKLVNRDKNYIYNYFLKQLTGNNKNSLRTDQYRAIDSIMNNRDTLVVMPTGRGKSVCFQIPAILKENTTIVFSPLIALMYDQVSKLIGSYISATYINSSLPKEDVDMRTKLIKENTFKLAYVTPERFYNRHTDYKLSEYKLSSVNYSLIVVDEAHCIDKWGRNFRPAYDKLGEFREEIGNPPIIALTASASKEVQKRIIKNLKMKNPEIIVTGFYRTNLKLEIFNTSKKENKLLEILNKHINNKVLIYTLTINDGENLKSFLDAKGFKTEIFHSKLENKDKNDIINRFKDNPKEKPINILIATSAFGMGMDIKDIRVVVHFHIPSNIEDYYQQIGRAGRDGKDAFIYLLYRKGDEKLNKYMLNMSLEKNKKLSNEDKENIKIIENEELETMLNYTKTNNKWKFILDYFGDTTAKQNNSNNLSWILILIIIFLLYLIFG